MAPGVGGADVYRAVLSVEPALLVAKGTGGGVGGRAGAAGPADVGRYSRIALRVPGSLGRPAGDADPCNLRARLRLSSRNCRSAGPPFQIAGDPIALRALCRADPRR